MENRQTASVSVVKKKKKYIRKLFLINLKIQFKHNLKKKMYLQLEEKKFQFLKLFDSFLMSCLEAMESRADSRWSLLRLLFRSPPSLFECR
jgi:hypothetical protein